MNGCLCSPYFHPINESRKRLNIRRNPSIIRKKKKKLLRKCEKEKSTRKGKEKSFSYTSVVTKILHDMLQCLYSTSTHTIYVDINRANQFHCFSLILHDFDGTHSASLFVLRFILKKDLILLLYVYDVHRGESR